LAIALLIANGMGKIDVCRFEIKLKKKIERRWKKSFQSNLWQENTMTE